MRGDFVEGKGVAVDGHRHLGCTMDESPVSLALMAKMADASLSVFTVLAGRLEKLTPELLHELLVTTNYPPKMLLILQENDFRYSRKTNSFWVLDVNEKGKR